MTTPLSPPLNGRNIAEYYVAGEAAKLSTLREYAKPPALQQARIIMYDPIRRFAAEYFKSGRDAAILDRITKFLDTKQFENPEYAALFHKSNIVAIENLRNSRINGEFQGVVVAKNGIVISGLRALSTVDFFATFVPKAANGTIRRVGVIISPAGIKRAAEKRKQWLNIESEVAFRSAIQNGHKIDSVMYLDLPKQGINKHVGPKKQIWAEIEATCYRIVRDWRDIRLSMHLEESGAS